jgi:molybdopterin-guanine dinucleotide biosynthesis protein A
MDEKSSTGRPVGVLLAGGLARRMGGGDKALLRLGGEPILAHAIARLGRQVETMVINANGDPDRFAQFTLPVVADTIEGFAGPLAGVLAGFDWALAHAPRAQWIVTVASDTPFFPADLVARLAQAVADAGADLACAASGGRHHPVFGLWPVRLRDDLAAAMTQEDIRKVDVWTARHRLAVAEFSDRPFDPFFNANRPEDLARAEALLAQGAA